MSHTHRKDLRQQCRNRRYDVWRPGLVALWKYNHFKSSGKWSNDALYCYSRVRRMAHEYCVLNKLKWAASVPPIEESLSFRPVNLTEFRNLHSRCENQSKSFLSAYKNNCSLISKTYKWILLIFKTCKWKSRFTQENKNGRVQWPVIERNCLTEHFNQF